MKNTKITITLLITIVSTSLIIAENREVATIVTSSSGEQTKAYYSNEGERPVSSIITSGSGNVTKAYSAGEGESTMSSTREEQTKTSRDEDDKKKNVLKAREKK